MTTRKRGALNSTEVRWRTIRASRIISLIGMAFGAVVAPYGAHRLYHDRPSLQWPTVPGIIMQAEVREHYGAHSHYSHLEVTYAFKVNGQRYVSHQICLGALDHGRVGTSSSFAASHPPRSSVDVHYDPSNPANAVLIPGADEFSNHIFIYAGVAVFVLSVFQLFRTRKEYTRLAAERPKVQAARPAPSKPTLSSEPFLTYEPGSKRKLNAFPDRECLLDMLDQGKSIQVWKPDDRVIDVSGHLCRLIGRENNKHYNMEPTGEVWDWKRLLSLATGDAALIKKNPKAIECRVQEAPDDRKIAVIMQCVSELPAAPLWLWIVLGLFFLVFFLAVFFAAGYLFLWLRKP